MAESRVKWYGEKIKEHMRMAFPDAWLFTASEFIKIAASRAPKGATGRLRASAYVKTHKTSTYQNKKWHNKEVKLFKSTHAIAGFAAFYAPIVEYGGGGRAARSFLRSTFDERKTFIATTLVDKMREKLRNLR